MHEKCSESPPLSWEAGGGGLDQLSHSLLSLEMLHTGDDGMLPSMARWLSEEVALRVWHVELHVGAAKATLTS